MKKWIIGCGLVFLLALITAGGLGYWGYTELRSWNVNRKAKAQSRKALVEAGITQRRQYLETHLSKETRDLIPSDFYTYDGFRDWWRMPLVFPYQLMCIDTRDQAGLASYDPQHPVADPNKSSSGVLSDVTRIATDNSILLFLRETGNGSIYGMVHYNSGEQSMFETEVELWAAARKSGYTGTKNLIAIDDMFNAYYTYGKDFLGHYVEATPWGSPSRNNIMYHQQNG